MTSSHTPEQRDLLDRMAGLCVETDPEKVLSQVRAMADAGDDEAGNLMAQWQYWQRHESRLMLWQPDAVQAVSMMLHAARNGALSEAFGTA